MKGRERMVVAGFAALFALAACGDGEPQISAPDTGVAPAVDVQQPAPDLSAAPDLTPDLGAAPPREHVVPFGPEDDTFHVGPHVMHTTGSEVTLIWEDTVSAAGWVEYGRTESYGARVESASGTLHEVTLTGLAPATLYHYRACAGERCTRDLTLSTAPLPGQLFRFVVYGDSRSDPVSHGAVADMIVASQPALVLNVGDIVADGERSQFKTEHFDPTRQLGHYVPIYVSIGNHEWKESEPLGELDVPNFREYLAFPKEPEHRKDELSYSFRYGDAFFLALDNTMDGGDVFFPLGVAEPPLWQWLREQAESEAAQSARWRFAFMHYPPGSPCQDDWGNIIATRDHVLPLLRENGFHAVFAGHVHNYERQNWEGLTVIISGGGGASLEKGANCTGAIPELEQMHVTYHHVTVDLGEDSAHLRAIDLEGQVFDEITIPN